MIYLIIHKKLRFVNKNPKKQDIFLFISIDFRIEKSYNKEKMIQSNFLSWGDVYENHFFEWHLAAART